MSLIEEPNSQHRGMSPLERKRTITAYMFMTPAFAFLFVFLLIPLAIAFYLSFTDYELLTPPQFIGLKNFSDLFKDALFWRGLKNSFLYLTVTPMLIILSIVLAIVVNRPLKGVNFFRALYYIPAVTSMVAVGLIFNLVFAEPGGLINGALRALGLIHKPIHFLTDPNSVLGSIMGVTVWRGVGYYMVIFLAALQSIPEELYEAAAIDGANRFQQHIRITVPLLRPAITFVAIISSISALKVFDEIFVMTDGTGGLRDSGLTLVFYLYRQGFVYLELGYAAAIAVAFTVVTLVLSIINLQFMERDND